ncbi:MAG TPA: hypothetical protein VN328_10250 [Thermodesulfovibrionales bacterium]|nr:hypothetical protein [Thermodesulfovibrionales bacterium]
MTKTALRKEKWTLSFDSSLKDAVIREAKEKGIYPVNLLEDMVREKFNPYGYTDVKDSVAHVRAIRKKSKEVSGKAFLEEIKRWQKSNS